MPNFGIRFLDWLIKAPRNADTYSLCVFHFAATDYVQTSMSYPCQRGDLSVLESHYIVGAVNCLSFLYYMSGEDVGRLNVYIVGQDEATSLLWRLAGNQGNEWNIAQLPIDAAEGFKVGRIAGGEKFKRFRFWVFKMNSPFIAFV